MATITISPKAMKQDDLVAIPREEYERLIRSSERPSKGKSLDARLAIARAEEERGELIGPFNDVRSLMKSLRGK